MTRLVIDLGLEKIVRSVTDLTLVSSINAKRGSEIFEVQFVQDGNGVEMDNATLYRLGIKSATALGNNYLVAASEFVKTGSGSSALYTVSPEWDVQPLILAFAAAGEPPTLSLKLEVMWTPPGVKAKRSQLVTLVTENELNRGNESVPTDSVPPYPMPDDIALKNDVVLTVAGRKGDVTLAKDDVGLDQVDNTSDANKPISTATQAGLDGKAALEHTHPALDISDSTAAGRALLTAADAAAQRSAIGLNNVPNVDATNASNIGTGTLAVARLASSVLRTGRVVFASQIGCALNSNVLTGGGTNDTTTIQTALDVIAAAGGGEFVLDGVALVSGLDVGSNTTFRFLPGSGLFQIAGSNRAVIHNKHQSGSTRTDSNISICGPGIINQNRATQSNALVDWVVGVDLNGVAGFAIMDGFTIKNSVKFGTRFTNCEHILSRGITAIQDSVTVECDGVHVNGPFEHCLVENTTVVNVDDDGVGINTDETYLDGNAYAYVSYGGGKTVVVRNITLVNTNQGVRVLNQLARLESVMIDGVFGSIGSYGVNAQVTFGHGSGNVGSLVVKNVDVRLRDDGNRYGSTNAEPVPYNNVVCVDLQCDLVHLSNITGQFSDGRPIVYLGTGCSTSSMCVNGVATSRDNTLIQNVGSVDTLVLSDFLTLGTAVDTSGGTLTNFARGCGGAGTVLSGTVSNEGDVITISATPVLLANWQFEESTAATSIADSTGSGNALDAADFTSSTGKISNGADLNGSSSYFEASTINLSGNHSFTIAGWFNVTDYSSPRVLLAQFGDIGTQGQAYQVYINTDGTIRLQVHSSGSTTEFTSSGTVSAGTWQFICLRHDHTTQTMYLTVDTTADPFTYTGTVDNCSQHLRIGCNGDSSGGYPAYFFYGKLDEWSAWNYKIDDTAVAAVYNSGAGAQPPF